MFDINNLDCVKFQFGFFEKGGGKLPSFSISSLEQEKWSSIIDKLIIKKKVGDYTFYDSKDNKYWFSFCSAYCCLNNEMDHATILLTDKVKGDGRYEASYLLMQAYMYRLVSTGNLMIHAAATNYDNNAILFCGSSGAGKSTQANLWKKYLPVKIINYDKPCIINDNGTVYAHGSPWSGKEALYINDYAPLKAIVFVKKAQVNRVVKITNAQAFANVFLHNYVYPINTSIEQKYISAINEIISNIPVYELYCDISEEAIKILFNELFPTKNYYEAKQERQMKYRIKDVFEMKEIAGEYVVIPRGASALSFNATVVFNEAGAFLWKRLSDFSDANTLIRALMDKYSIDETLAQKDVTAFLSKMQNNGLIETKE